MSVRFKFSWISFFFLIVNIALVYASFQIKLKARPSGPLAKDNSKEQLNMQGVTLYGVKTNEPFIYLEGESVLQLKQSQKIQVLKPEGYLFTQDKKKMNYDALRGLIFENEKKIYLQENAQVDLEGLLVKAQKLSYSLKKNYLWASENVQSFYQGIEDKEMMQIDSQYLQLWVPQEKTIYTGKVQGNYWSSKVEKTYFSSDKLMGLKSKAYLELIGQVEVTRELMNAKSRRGEVYFFKQDKKPKKYFLYGDVQLSSKVKDEQGQWVNRKAFAEKLEGDVNGKYVVLTGFPKAIQAQDLIMGSKITLYEGNEIIEVEKSDSKFEIK